MPQLSSKVSTGIFVSGRDKSRLLESVSTCMSIPDDVYKELTLDVGPQVPINWIPERGQGVFQMVVVCFYVKEKKFSK